MTDAVTGINQADYMKLFMQELSYQDPLKPIDNREFMTQMAQFSALQSAQESSESLKKIEMMTRGNQALMLIGKHVGLTDKASDRYLVEGVSFIGKEPKLIFLTDDNEELKSLDQITRVKE